jgi:hypothetical protein
MMYHEVTGSSLVKVDIAGKIKKIFKFFFVDVFLLPLLS